MGRGRRAVLRGSHGVAPVINRLPVTHCCNLGWLLDGVREGLREEAVGRDLVLEPGHWVEPGETLVEQVGGHLSWGKWQVWEGHLAGESHSRRCDLGTQLEEQLRVAVWGSWGQWVWGGRRMRHRRGEDHHSGCARENVTKDARGATASRARRRTSW